MLLNVDKRKSRCHEGENAAFNISDSAYAKATARPRRMMNAALPHTPRRRKVVCKKRYEAECGEDVPSTFIKTNKHGLNE